MGSKSEDMLLPIQNFPFPSDDRVNANQASKEFKLMLDTIVSEKIDTIIQTHVADGRVEFNAFPDGQPQPNEHLKYRSFHLRLNKLYPETTFDDMSVQHLMGIADSLSLHLCEQASLVLQAGGDHQRLKPEALRTLQNLYSYQI